MRSDYLSVQSVQVTGPEDTVTEVEYDIALECTAPYSPGYFDPRWGGEPPSGPEFEVTSIAVNVPRVNWKGHVESESTLELTYDQFCAVVGWEIAEKLVALAMEEAATDGGF